MSEPFAVFGGVDFSGAKEPLSNLWSAVGVRSGERLRIVSLRPHPYRQDLGAFVRSGWREVVADAETILCGIDFPFAVPEDVAGHLLPGGKWPEIVDWIADRPAEEVRTACGDLSRSSRIADSKGALAPLDLRLYKQTVEGIRWLQGLMDSEEEVSIHPLAGIVEAPVNLIEVYPSATVRDLGLPRRRTPGRPGEVRARAAALRTFLEFESADIEATTVTLEDAWDAVIACLTAFLCRNDLEQPFRVAPATQRDRIGLEGWIYRPPAALA